MMWRSGCAALLVIVLAVPGARASATEPNEDPAKEAWSLKKTAERLRERGRLDESIATLERALALAGAARGLERKRIGEIHFALARAYEDRAEQSVLPRSLQAATSAASHFERTLTLWADERDVTDIQRAVAQWHLAHMYNRVGRFADAVQMFETSVPHIERRFGKDSAQIAAALLGFGLANTRTHRFEAAERCYRRAIAIYRATPRHERDVVNALHLLGEMFWSHDNYGRAAETLEEAIQAAEKYFGPDAPQLIPPLGTLAAVRNYQTEFWRIGAIYDRIAGICRAHPGGDPMCADGGPLRPDILGTLAYNASRDREAARHYQQWLNTVAGVDWNADPRIGLFQMISDRLAGLYERFGDYEKAIRVRQRIVEVYGSVAVLSRMVPLEQLRLAKDYERAGDAARAADLYRMVIPRLESQVREPLMTEDGQRPGDCIEPIAIELAAYYARTGQRDRGRSLLQTDCRYVSRQISQHEYGLRLRGRARLLEQIGSDRDAVPLYEEVLRVFEQTVGPDTPAAASVLLALARTALSSGDVAKGQTLLKRATDIYQSTLPLIESHASEDERRSALELYSMSLDLTVSLDRNIAPGDPAARAFAASIVLERKGRLLESSRVATAALRERGSGAAAQAFDELSRVRAERAALVLPGLLDRSRTADPARVQALRSREDALERLAAKLTPGYQPVLERIAADRICAALASGEAAVEMITYRPYDASARAWRAPRLVGYVFRADGTITSIDLGPTREIAAAVAAFRDELSSTTNKSHDHAQALYRLVIEPLEPALVRAETVYFSPEGDLALAPLGALVDASQRFLLERFDVRYLTAARDLLRPHRAATSSPPVLFGNPDYRKSAAATQSGDSGFNSTFHFTPLAWTEHEVRHVATSLDAASVYTGTEATEAQVKQVQRPKILHLATHAFFFPDLSAMEERLAGQTIGVPDDPLLRAGLALACANAPCDPHDDGVLTALEVTTMDLDGTDLVVLSACDTGVGDASSHDGVYGLRRAFVLAGAGATLSSLWHVKEGDADAFIIAFYQRVKDLGSPAAALRDLQTRWAREGSRTHPNYWAAFVLYGR